MNPRHLKYFMEVCQTNNIQTAADRLYISRQGVSKVIRAMEQELGQSLFIRSSGGLYPTDFALQILPHVQRIIKEYDCINDLNSFSPHKQEHVSIYSFASIPGFLGSAFLRSFNQAHPKVSLSFLEAPDDVILSKLESHQCSFAITYGPIDQTKFDCTELFFSRFCLHMNPQHPLSQKQLISASDLDGQTISGNGRAYRCFRDAVQKNLFSSGYKVHVPFESSNERLLSQLALEGMALVASYDFQLSSDTQGLVTRYFEDEALGSSFYLVENKSSQSDAAMAFKSFLLDWFNKKGS